MASDLNSVTLVGRLTRDPELRSTGSGQSVCEVRLAYNISKKTGNGWEDEGQFVNVTIWGNQGEMVAQYLTKGQRMGVNGRLMHRTWEGDGQRREQHSITANSVQFLSPKNEGGAPAARQSTAPVAAAPAPAYEDDIPF